MTSVLVLGAGGFIGNALCYSLESRGYGVFACSTKPLNFRKCENISLVPFHLLKSDSDWAKLLKSTDCVVNCIGNSVLSNPSHEVTLATRIAAIAGSVGVRRYVYISSVKVLGDQTNSKYGVPHMRMTNKPDFFSSLSKSVPTGQYAETKFRIETSLQGVAGVELVIVRPPLVYGPGVKGNMLRLMRYIDRGYFFPFGSLQNLRSFIGIRNLTAFIELCITHPDAVGKTLLATDGEDLSLSDLVTLISGAMGKNFLMLEVPIGVLSFVATILGRGADFAQLSGSLRVDQSYSNETLGWDPPNSVREEIENMVAWYCGIAR